MPLGPIEVKSNPSNYGTASFLLMFSQSYVNCVDK